MRVGCSGCRLDGCNILCLLIWQAIFFIHTLHLRSQLADGWAAVIAPTGPYPHGANETLSMEEIKTPASWCFYQALACPTSPVTYLVETTGNLLWSHIIYKKKKETSLYRKRDFKADSIVVKNLKYALSLAPPATPSLRFSQQCQMD